MRIKIYLFAGAILWLALYTYFCLSPSSYGYALRALGAQEDGVILGEPRGIRSDEWSAGVPLFQIAVLNNFNRFNSVSIYGEDLRTYIGLPLKDWALIFKPYFWPFFFLEPARALSFYHGFWILFFISGYFLLLRHLGFEPVAGIAGALLIYYSGFSQTWWTGLVLPAAGLPWIMLTVMAPLFWPIKLFLITYLSVGVLTASLYAPIFITFVFFGLTLLIVFDPAILRSSRIVTPILGVALASLIVYAYLYDLFDIMQKTTYPGQRRTTGGGVVFLQWLSQFFPYLVISSPTYGFMNRLQNVCEASTVGSYLPLMAIVFVDYGKVVRNYASDQAQRGVTFQIGGLLLAFLTISAWQLLPIPGEFGAVALWNRFMAGRLFFVSGLMLLLAGLLALKAFSLRLDRNRMMVFSVLAGLAWLIPGTLWSSDFTPPRHLITTCNDLTVVLGMWLLYFYSINRQATHFLPTGLILVALIPNVVAWAPFNPIQSTRPLFSIQHEKTPVTLALDKLASLHPKGWITLPFYNGALLGGLGYKSLAHILPSPQLAWFRPYFPEMTDDRFEQVFNRYAHIVPEAGQDFPPYVPQPDVVVVPGIRFGAPFEIPIELVMKSPDQFTEMAGCVDRIEVDNTKSLIKIFGWAKMASPAGRAETHLFVRTGLPLGKVTANMAMRPDVYRKFKDDRLLISGFEITASLSEPISRSGDLADLEIFCEDRIYGKTKLKKDPEVPISIN